MMISCQRPLDLGGKFKFKWTNTGFRYLGIIITSVTSQLFEANYGKLITENRKDLARWEILHLTLMGTTETVRINVSPRLLFQFQTLPIVVSNL